MKRLKMMPEVLPEPRAPQPPGGARTRTLAHMQRLLATAGAGAALAGCSKDAPHTVAPIETGPLARANSTGTVTATTDTPPTATKTPPTATASATEYPTATGPTGYAVVDPIPAPMICPGVANQIQATATWRQTAAGMVVDVYMPKANSTDTIAYSAPPSPYGGALVSDSAPGNTKLFTLSPTAGTSSLSVTVGSLCNGQPLMFSIGIDLHNPPANGATIPMTLSSY